MGMYLNKTSMGNPLPAMGKIAALIQDGATVLPSPPTKFVENLICVVDNGPFQAAAYCFSEKEMQDFSYEDGRPKTWMIHPKAKELAQ